MGKRAYAVTSTYDYTKRRRKITTSTGSDDVTKGKERYLEGSEQWDAGWVEVTVRRDDRRANPSRHAILREKHRKRSTERHSRPGVRWRAKKHFLESQDEQDDLGGTTT